MQGQDVERQPEDERREDEQVAPDPEGELREPQAQDEGSRGGRLVLAYSTLKPGDRVELWLQFQVNPSNVGHRSYALELDDDTQRIARVERTITVLP